MPVIIFPRTLESTKYTVLTHIGVWVKIKITKYTKLYHFYYDTSPSSASNPIFVIIVSINVFKNTAMTTSSSNFKESIILWLLCSIDYPEGNYLCIDLDRNNNANCTKFQANFA